MSPQGQHEETGATRLRRRNRLVAFGLLGFAALMILLTLTLPRLFASLNP